MTITELNALPPQARAQEIVASVRLSGDQLNDWFRASVGCFEDCTGFCPNCLEVGRNS